MQDILLCVCVSMPLLLAVTCRGYFGLVLFLFTTTTALPLAAGGSAEFTKQGPQLLVSELSESCRRGTDNTAGHLIYPFTLTLGALMFSVCVCVCVGHFFPPSLDQ